MIKKKIIIGIVVVIVFIVSIPVFNFLLEVVQVNAKHEKYGKNIGVDGFGDMCAMSQMTISSQYQSGKCDYSKPVIDFEQNHIRTQELKKDLKWKAENLLKAHNDLVNLNKNRLPDPIDYGFDLDTGFTNNTKKDEWCGIVLEEQKRMITLMTALENSLNWLSSEKEQPLELQEMIVEDERLKNAMYDQMYILKKVIIDFDC